MIVSTVREYMMDNIFQNYNSQVWAPKELIIILNSDHLDIKKWKKEAKKYKNVAIYQLPNHISLGECFNFAVKKAKYEVISKMDDDDYYSPFYLSEQMQALKEHPDVSLVGKNTVYTYIESKKALGILSAKKENRFDRRVKGPTMTFKKEIFKNIKFADKNLGTNKQFFKDCQEYGYKIYVTSKNNFVYIRRKEKDHTWKADDELMFKKLRQVTYTDDFKSHVLLPIKGENSK
ncbi:glycosyltransferase [Cytobacillus oceanisediminis]|uniref:glycosyltransferase n=1 Tax=Cytobacillus oceanisediminis TaxID=665099 RepID=UPI0023DB0EFE|nr:glycosyltransferase [Cytobacillus oceanisediminis]MDF2035792.1 glycosyltransferase [Cytobacillus oceanisediminis]